MNLPVAAELTRGDDSNSLIARAGGRSGLVLNGVYRLQECIGHGGMGEVYAAQHVRLGRRLAVKILRRDPTPKAVQRFRREAQAIARIENEYVVNVLDCGELDEETPYLVMELLQGQDLRRVLEGAAPLPIPRAVSLVWEACQGIAAVHDAGLVHRDLKPENLFVCKRATGEDWCKVLDFGVAKQEVSSSTVEGALVGTVRYMAPEQLRDGASVSPRSDIYALGAILYECLTGRTPHSGSAIHELMFKIMNDEPLPLDRLRTEVSPGLARIVARCLRKAPERRYTSARELAAALGPFARPGGESLPTQANTVDLEGRPARSRLFRSGSLLFLVGLITGTALSGALFALPSAGSSKAVSARPAASVASVSTPPPGIAGSSNADAESSAPASTHRPELLTRSDARATALVGKAKLARIAAPPPLKAVPSATVPASTPRFDSSNPYIR